WAKDQESSAITLRVQRAIIWQRFLCCIRHMMPRLLSFVLRRSGAAVGLLALMAVCLALPARQVLLPLWPGVVEEQLVKVGPDRVERRLGRAGLPPSETEEVVARSRPIMLWRIEYASGEVDHAWLAGFRTAAGALAPELPDWFD